MPDLPTSYPPVDFYFQLEFEGLPAPNSAAFQEVSGISVALASEDAQAGPDKHHQPAPAKYSNLVLRRGLMTQDSAVAKWVKTTIGNGSLTPVIPRNVRLHLHNPAGMALATWDFKQAWPVAWVVSEFKSPDDALAVEKLELSYTSFVRR